MGGPVSDAWCLVPPGPAGIFAGSRNRRGQDQMTRNEIDCNRAAPTPDFLASAASFHHPVEVLDRPDLPLSERRAILTDWASDAHAAENAPWLRQLRTGARTPVREVLRALKALDARAQASAEDAQPFGDANLNKSTFA